MQFRLKRSPLRDRLLLLHNTIAIDILRAFEESHFKMTDRIVKLYSGAKSKITGKTVLGHPRAIPIGNPARGDDEKERRYCDPHVFRGIMVSWEGMPDNTDKVPKPHGIDQSVWKELPVENQKEIA